MGEYAEDAIEQSFYSGEDDDGMSMGEYEESFAALEELDREVPMVVTTKRSRREKLNPCRMVWETRDGRKIRVCSMPDSHLLNAILYVERHARLIQANEVVGACDAFELDVLEDLMVETPEEFLVEYMPYRKLYNEARRRKLVLVPITTWFSRAYDTPLPPLEG